MSEVLTSEQREFLARSPEFQRIVAEDPELGVLDAESCDRAAGVAEVLECLGGRLYLGKRSLGPLTLAKWSLLWCLDNNFVGNEEEITPLDVDIFLYVLSHRTVPDLRELELLPVRAAGFCERLGVDCTEAASEILHLTRRAFSPLNFLPHVPGDDDAAERFCFDAEWMIFLASIAVRESGHDMRYVLYRMPLALVLYCVVNFLRRHDDKGLIYRHTREDVAARIIERVNELGSEFCRGESDLRVDQPEQTAKDEVDDHADQTEVSDTGGGDLLVHADADDEGGNQARNAEHRNQTD